MFVEPGELLTQVSRDHTVRAKLEDGASISVVHPGSQSVQIRSAIFMWFQLFIEVLIRMHHKSSERKELIDICKKSYQGNEEEQKLIDEFEKNYGPENAIWWYTRESCLYRMLNKALRVQDFDQLFALRFFITDIARQLKSEYEKFNRTSDTRSTFRVYRGQLLGNDELTLIKNNTGQLLSMNSFLSTSRDRFTASRFALHAPANRDTQKVIFEIEINPRCETKPFADVTKISYCAGENEVLISLGALFRIGKVIEDKNDQLWVVHMALVNQDDSILKETLSCMKKEIGDETDLDSLGKILIEMGEYEQAEKYYRRMLVETKLLLANAQLGLGKACLGTRKSDCLDHLNGALQIRQQLLERDHANIGECYSDIGKAHLSVREDYPQAFVNLKKAIEIQEKRLPSGSLELALTYHHIAGTYGVTGEHDMALQYFNKALKIRKTFLPFYHPKIGSTYHNIGNMYREKRDYSEALRYYEEALDIFRMTLPPGHDHIIKTEKKIRELREKKTD